MRRIHQVALRSQLGRGAAGPRCQGRAEASRPSPTAPGRSGLDAAWMRPSVPGGAATGAAGSSQASMRSKVGHGCFCPPSWRAAGRADRAAVPPCDGDCRHRLGRVRRWRRVERSQRGSDSRLRVAKRMRNGRPRDSMKLASAEGWQGGAAARPGGGHLAASPSSMIERYRWALITSQAARPGRRHSPRPPVSLANVPCANKWSPLGGTEGG